MPGDGPESMRNFQITKPGNYWWVNHTNQVVLIVEAGLPKKLYICHHGMSGSYDLSDKNYKEGFFIGPLQWDRP